MRIAYFHEKLSECDVFSARVHGIVKDSWRNKARCGIACIGIKIKIFYSSWKIHHNTDATAEWKSEFLAIKDQSAFMFYTQTDQRIIFRRYLLSMAAGNALALVNF